MSYYLLEETMRPCSSEELHGCAGCQYAAVLTTPEWQAERDLFDMGIEMEPDAGNIFAPAGGEPFIVTVEEGAY